jgi:hypothetical protein
VNFFEAISFVIAKPIYQYKKEAAPRQALRPSPTPSAKKLIDKPAEKPADRPNTAGAQAETPPLWRGLCSQPGIMRDRYPMRSGCDVSLFADTGQHPIAFTLKKARDDARPSGLV